MRSPGVQANFDRNTLSALRSRVHCTMVSGSIGERLVAGCRAKRKSSQEAPYEVRMEGVASEIALAAPLTLCRLCVTAARTLPGDSGQDLVCRPAVRLTHLLAVAALAWESEWPTRSRPAARLR